VHFCLGLQPAPHILKLQQSHTTWTFFLMALFLEIRKSPYGSSDLDQNNEVKGLQKLYFLIYLLFFFDICLNFWCEYLFLYLFQPT
jgi:hypothetical protein